MPPSSSTRSRKRASDAFSFYDYKTGTMHVELILNDSRYATPEPTAESHSGRSRRATSPPPTEFADNGTDYDAQSQSGDDEEFVAAEADAPPSTLERGIEVQDEVELEEDDGQTVILEGEAYEEYEVPIRGDNGDGQPPEVEHPGCVIVRDHPTTFRPEYTMHEYPQSRPRIPAQKMTHFRPFGSIYEKYGAAYSYFPTTKVLLIQWIEADISIRALFQSTITSKNRIRCLGNAVWTGHVWAPRMPCDSSVVYKTRDNFQRHIKEFHLCIHRHEIISIRDWATALRRTLTEKQLDEVNGVNPYRCID